jgi:PTS system mannitol-specific IIA component
MSVLSKDKIKANAILLNKEDAIITAGQLLVKAGHVENEYIDKMLERESVSPTYLGGGIAVPHGTHDSKATIKSTGISIVHVPEGVEYEDGEKAYLIIGLAAVGDEHMDLLSNIALLVADDEELDKIMKAASVDELYDIFSREIQ